MWIVWCLFARRVRRGGEVDGALKPRPTRAPNGGAMNPRNPAR